MRSGDHAAVLNDFGHSLIHLREHFQPKCTTDPFSARRSVVHWLPFSEKTQSFSEGLVLPEHVGDVALLVSSPGEEAIHLAANAEIVVSLIVGWLVAPRCPVIAARWIENRFPVANSG